MPGIGSNVPVKCRSRAKECSRIWADVNCPGVASELELQLMMHYANPLAFARKGKALIGHYAIN